MHDGMAQAYSTRLPPRHEAPTRMGGPLPDR